MAQQIAKPRESNTAVIEMRKPHREDRRPHTSARRKPHPRPRPRALPSHHNHRLLPRHLRAKPLRLPAGAKANQPRRHRIPLRRLVLSPHLDRRPRAKPDRRGLRASAPALHVSPPRHADRARGPQSRRHPRPRNLNASSADSPSAKPPSACSTPAPASSTSSTRPKTSPSSAPSSSAKSSTASSAPPKESVSAPSPPPATSATAPPAPSPGSAPTTPSRSTWSSSPPSPAWESPPSITSSAPSPP